MADQDPLNEVHEEEEMVVRTDPVDDTEPFVVPPDLGILDEDEEDPIFVVPPEMMASGEDEQAEEEAQQEELQAEGEGEEQPAEIFSDEGISEEEEEVPELSRAELEKEIGALSQSIEAQAERLMANNRRAILSSSLFIILVAIYMVWAGGLLKTAFRPEAVADAATGVAERAIPQAAESLDLMLEDGAYDIVDRFGNEVLLTLPAYREALVLDLEQAKSQVTDLLVQEVISAVLALDVTLLAAADDETERSRLLDEALGLLDQQLAASLAEEGPQEMLSSALDLAVMSQSALEQMALGRQPNHDREILLTWLSVIAKSTEE